MTIPISSAKYNLLQDTNASVKTTKCQKSAWLSFVLILILFIPVVLLFVYHFYVLTNDETTDHQSYMNRAELYSLDEFLNKNTLPSKLRNSNTNLIYDTNDNNHLKLVCYYIFPASKDDPSALMPENVECNLCTHINIGFATIRNNTIILNSMMKNIISQIVNLKTCNSQLKFLLSVGGASAENGFPSMVSTHASRKVFIRSLKAILRQYQLDGVDLDWEFPVVSSTYKKNSKNQSESINDRQRQHFTQLLREIRAEYIREKRGYLLSVAVAAPEHIVNAAYDVEEMNQYVDYINLMSYDFHFYTPYTPFTGFNAPLYSKKDEYFYFSTLNINYSANLWQNKGMERSKIIVGLPTYGHSFTLVNVNNAQVGSPASGFGKLGSLGFVWYSDICDFIKNNTNVNIVYDNQTFSPYLHNNREWVSYENKESMMSKGRYIKDSQFGGAMIYSLNSDDFSGHCSLNSDVKFYLTRQLRDTLLDNDL